VKVPVDVCVSWTERGSLRHSAFGKGSVLAFGPLALDSKTK